MIRALTVTAAGFLGSLAAGWLVFPSSMYRKVEPQAQFSHKAHTGEKNSMACTDCHAFQEDGQFAGIPKLEGCATCHAEAMGDSKAEKQLVERYVKPGVEPPWPVYARQPDNAWFPHNAHVQRGKLKCEQCHGGHGQSNELRAMEVNRLSGYSRDVMGRPAGRFGLRRAAGMRMDDCIACHRQRGLEHACLDCHR